MNEESHGQIESDQKLLSIIEALHDRQRAGITELSHTLEMPKSTIHKHLKTLDEHEYVVNDGGEYRLSLLFLQLGGAVRHANKMCSKAIESVQNIADRTNKLGMFSILERNKGIITYYYNDKYEIDAAYVGTVFKLHQNAAGKAILATMRDEDVHGIIDETGLPAATENTIQDRETLFDELETIRENRYAVSIGERQPGVQSISAAVKDYETGDIGALTLSGPVSGINKEKIRSEYAEVVVDESTELELKLR